MTLRQRQTGSARNVRCHYLTLMECLVVMTLGAMSLSLAYQVLSEGWKTDVRMLKRARIWSETCLVRQRWRDFVGDTDPATWVADKNGFATGDKQLRIVDNALVNDQKRKLVLPPRCHAEFAIEKPEGLAPVAILTLCWNERLGNGHRRPRRVRLVATGKKQSEKQRQT